MMYYDIAFILPRENNMDKNVKSEMTYGTKKRKLRYFAISLWVRK